MTDLSAKSAVLNRKNYFGRKMQHVKDFGGEYPDIFRDDFLKENTQIKTGVTDLWRTGESNP